MTDKSLSDVVKPFFTPYFFQLMNAECGPAEYCDTEPLGILVIDEDVLDNLSDDNDALNGVPIESNVPSVTDNDATVNEKTLTEAGVVAAMADQQSFPVQRYLHNVL